MAPRRGGGGGGSGYYGSDSSSSSCAVCERNLTLEGSRWKDAATLAQFVVTCICFIILIVSLLPALRSQWTKRGKLFWISKFSILIAILATISLDILDLIAIALTEEQVTVSYLFYIIFILASAMARIGEMMAIVFIPQLVREQLNTDRAKWLRTSVKWIAIAIFIVITLLELAGIGVVSAYYAEIIRAGVYGDDYNPSLQATESKLDFTIAILLLLYALFLLVTVVITCQRRATAAMLLLVALVALFFINELMGAVANGISFANPAKATQALNNASFFISQITSTVVILLAAILGLRSFQRSDEPYSVTNLDTSQYADASLMQDDTSRATDHRVNGKLHGDHYVHGVTRWTQPMLYAQSSGNGESPLQAQPQMQRQDFVADAGVGRPVQSSGPQYGWPSAPPLS